MRSKKLQAFKQAPWRLQARLTGSTVLPVIVLLVVGGMYLAVSARRAEVGRQVLDLQARRDELLRQHHELSAKLAELTSPRRMMEQAELLGFKLADLDAIEYIVVEGYEGPPAFIAPKPPSSPDPATWALSPAYSETLGDWLLRWMGIAGGGGQ